MFGTPWLRIKHNVHSGTVPTSYPSFFVGLCTLAAAVVSALTLQSMGEAGLVSTQCACAGAKDAALLAGSLVSAVLAWTYARHNEDLGLFFIDAGFCTAALALQGALLAALSLPHPTLG